MSSELDLSSPASAGRIRQLTFATVFRGYDPNQVLAYLSGVADHVEALESKVRQLESELKEAHRQKATLADQGSSRDPYESVSARVADLVRTFDLDVAKLRGDAEAEVDRLLAEARIEAERIRLDGQDKVAETRAEAERTLREARIEADKVLSGLASRRDNLLQELRAMRDQMLDTAKDLEAAIEGSVGDHVVMLEDARKGEPADATSISASKGQPDSGA